jgi:hypothetical protein
MALNVAGVRQRLADFDFKDLFTEELGWSQPTTRRPETLEWQGEKFELRQISHLAGVAVFEVVAEDGKIPYARTRAALQREIARRHHENLLIFLDKDRTQSLGTGSSVTEPGASPATIPSSEASPATCS